MPPASVLSYAHVYPYRELAPILGIRVHYTGNTVCGEVLPYAHT